MVSIRIIRDVLDFINLCMLEAHNIYNMHRVSTRICSILVAHTIISYRINILYMKMAKYIFYTRVDRFVRYLRQASRHPSSVRRKHVDQ